MELGLRPKGNESAGERDRSQNSLGEARARQKTLFNEEAEDIFESGNIK